MLRLARVRASFDMTLVCVLGVAVKQRISYKFFKVYKIYLFIKFKFNWVTFQYKKVKLIMFFYMFVMLIFYIAFWGLSRGRTLKTISPIQPSSINDLRRSNLMVK